MKKLIALLTALFCALPAAAETYNFYGTECPIYETEELQYCIIEPGSYGNSYINSKLALVFGLTETGRQRDELVIPEEIDGIKVNIDSFGFSSANIRKLVLPEISSVGAPLGVLYGFQGLKNLESVNLDSVKSIYRSSFEGMDKLKYITADGKNLLTDKELGERCFSGTGLEQVVLDTALSGYTGSRFQVYSKAAFKDCISLRTVHFADKPQELYTELFSGCKGLDYVCLSESAISVYGKAFADCPNLRTVVIPSAKTEMTCTLLEPYVKSELCSVDGDGDYCIFDDSSRVTILGVKNSAAGTYAERHGIRFIPSVISNGESSTVVAQAAQTATVTINGAAVPAYTVNGSVYVGESALKSFGFGMDWNGEARTTTVTKPEGVQWAVELCTNPAPYSIDVVSSDVKFILNGFPIPALNVGNGESIVDVNALAEAVLY